MQAGIYIVTNTESRKYYIGSTINLKKRESHHWSRLRAGTHRNTHLQRSWNKYGESVFEFGVLEYLDNPEELHLAEQFWMNTYRMEDKGLYNIATVGPAPMLGRHHTVETRAKMSTVQKGRVYPPLTVEHKSKISRALMGHPVSNETRAKLSGALMGNHNALGRVRDSARLGKPYPAFIHRDTGEVITTSVNLAAMCREWGLCKVGMRRVAKDMRSHYKGWELLCQPPKPEPGTGPETREPDDTGKEKEHDT